LSPVIWDILHIMFVMSYFISTISISTLIYRITRSCPSKVRYIAPVFPWNDPKFARPPVSSLQARNVSSSRTTQIPFQSLNFFEFFNSILRQSSDAPSTVLRRSFCSPWCLRKQRPIDRCGPCVASRLCYIYSSFSHTQLFFLLLIFHLDLLFVFFRF
jgi:hypothetical protein